VTIDFGAFDALTFDTYGTLIDWEAGIATALRDALPALAETSDDALCERFAAYESGFETPYQRYREVLADSLRALADEAALDVSDDAVARFAESVRAWPAFSDSAAALRALKRRYRLAVITNCDTDLFLASQERLGVEFDWIITAEIAQSYKPDHHNFEVAFATISVPRERILHVAQSLYHDHVPAKALGMTTVWIDRRHDRAGFGATPAADATPDARYTSMAAFADAAGC
jgi:2-haloacid dehalogenase